MNAVEIEEAVSMLAKSQFDSSEFPFQFLLAFGKKNTTIKKLRSGSSNKSDVNGVLQRNNIHIATCKEGEVENKLRELKRSDLTNKYKAKFVLATDGKFFASEDLFSGETIACQFSSFANHFGFFLPLAGISTIKNIRENSFDIRATGRLNKLYIELLKSNPEWGEKKKNYDMNLFMTKLIFCFFAEDTNIFGHNASFTETIENMTEADSSNTHKIIEEIFRVMNISFQERKKFKIPIWANKFPYVNGGLFSNSIEVPIFSKIARSYLIHIGNLDWTKINPDIFGSMVQVVAETSEREFLGMHYTSVPNILKLLNPLFLDELRGQLNICKNNDRKLLNLRKRLSKIRVFDPACGSGNFLVIAYKEMRYLENEINNFKGEPGRKTEIPITNFRGIEIRSFSAEIARLSLIIAKYQCDVLYLGQKEALTEFLPLESENWITSGNALTLDWTRLCPVEGIGVKIYSDDLFSTPLEQPEIDFTNEGGETFICGNPPYKGSNQRSENQTNELGELVPKNITNWKSMDYVSGWFLKACDYCAQANASFAFVTTSSICQGMQVSVLWPLIFKSGLKINFAYSPFKWSNLAAHNAGVSVVIVGLSCNNFKEKRLYSVNTSGEIDIRLVSKINAYLLNADNLVVSSSKLPISFTAQITDGSGALDGGFLILNNDEKDEILRNNKGEVSKFIKPYYGSSEFIKGGIRWCLWIEDEDLDEAKTYYDINERIQKVKKYRELAGTRAKTAVNRPHKFAWINKKSGKKMLIPTVFSENRKYITVGFMQEECIINNAASIVHSEDLSIFAIISSSLHTCWVRAIAGKLGESFRYTSATCFNTFPIPKLTQKNKSDLYKSAENILLTRELYFPRTISEIYDPDAMPAELKAVHDLNDEILERIYIGRKFKNNSERLENLFNLYSNLSMKKAKYSNLPI